MYTRYSLFTSSGILRWSAAFMEMVISEILSSVSYTHLDVYKRQMLSFIAAYLPAFIVGIDQNVLVEVKGVVPLQAGPHVKVGGDSNGPVSYTHLVWIRL